MPSSLPPLSGRNRSPSHSYLFLLLHRIVLSQRSVVAAGLIDTVIVMFVVVGLWVLVWFVVLRWWSVGGIVMGSNSLWIGMLRVRVVRKPTERGGDLRTGWDG